MPTGSDTVDDLPRASHQAADTGTPPVLATYQKPVNSLSLPCSAEIAGQSKVCSMDGAQCLLVHILKPLEGPWRGPLMCNMLVWIENDSEGVHVIFPITCA